MAQANHIGCSVTTRDAALIIILLELLDLVETIIHASDTYN